MQWMLLCVLGGILVILYVLSSRVNDGDRVSVELKVRQMLTLDTGINLDILRLRYRQLRDYDNVSTAAQQVEILLEDLHDDFRKLEIGHALDIASREWIVKQQDIEDFKRQNSVLVNSIYHFISLTEQIDTRLENERSRPTYEPLFRAITQNVLIFINEQQAQEIAPVLSAIGQLEELAARDGGPQASQGQLLARHGRQIINNHPPVQVLMRNISRSNFPLELERAYGEYVKRHHQMSLEAEFYRQWMAIFTLLMVLTVIWMTHSIRQKNEEIAKSHSLLHNVANHLGEGILSFDDEGRFNFINSRAETLLGLTRAELMHKSIADLFVPEAQRRGTSFREALAGSRAFEGEEWLLRPDGSSFPAGFLGGPLPPVGESQLPAGYVTSFRDLSEHYEAEARLRLSARVFDNLTEALSITDAEGTIRSVNAAFTTITGYTEAEAKGKKQNRLLGNTLYEEIMETMQRENKWMGEVIYRRKNQETFPAWISMSMVRDEEGKALHYITLFTDLSERKKFEAHARRLTDNDQLTGLANRKRFLERLQEVIRQVQQSHRPVAVLILDLDRFKHINDSLGHASGDRLLKIASERLLSLLKEGDMLARIGGDEFALLLPEISSHADAAQLASRILQKFESPFDLGDREVFTSTSVGIAIFPTDGSVPELLMKNADVALHKAKDAGRSAFRFFMEEDTIHSLEQLELETALRRSIEQEELLLFYQPQVSARDGSIYGVEALVRWQHPHKGLLMPNNFIPLAESSGYISDLGKWCLQTACEQLYAWQHTGLPIQRVAVNVSVRQLNDPEFVDMVFHTLETTGLPSHCLELELTESLLISNPERIFGIFARLRERGIRIAIDDFGTGYSSLSYLSRYPVDVVKIDKSFVDQLEHEAEHRSVVEAIILMSHAMGMETVAEGVEFEIQKNRLEQLGCDLLQGYFFSRPIPAEKIPALPRLTRQCTE
jgi:diguanylate cyclase (GGDEF)-like protein/PAS domain S-box-containing protein